MKIVLRAGSVIFLFIAVSLLFVQIFYSTRKAYGIVGNLTIGSSQGGATNFPGNVGIGTTSPLSALHVANSTATSLTNGFSHLRLETDIANSDVANTGGALITFSQRWQNATGPIRIGGIRGFKTAATGNYGGGVQLMYQTSADVNMSEGLTLNHLGNVGIGTTAPESRLHLSSSGTTRLRLNTATGTHGALEMAVNGTVKEYFWYDSTNNMLMMGPGTFGSGVGVDLNGNVGIGTTSPGNLLDVNGTSRFAGGSSTNWASMNIGGTNSINTAGNIYSYNKICSQNASAACDGAGGVVINGGGNSFFTGNVGIGTTGPNTNLDVNGVGHFYPSGVTPDNGYNGSLRFTKAAASGQYINLTRQSNWIWSIGYVYNTNNFAIGQGKTIDSNFTSPIFVIASEGNVGIAQTTPAALLDLGTAGTRAGVVRFAGGTSGNVTLAVAAAAGTWTMTLPTAGGTNGYQLATNGSGTTSWTAASSLRSMKNIIGEMQSADAFSKILNAKVYRFHYKQGAGTGDTNTEYVGLMADEAPWAMHYGGTVVNPVNTLGYMVLGIQALDKKISNQFEALKLTDAGNVLITQNSESRLYELKDSNAHLITKTAAFAKAVIADIQAGVIEVKKLIVDGVDIMKKIQALNDRIDQQQAEIDALKKQLEYLRNK